MVLQADISPKRISDLKSTLLSPSFTSHFAVKIVFPKEGLKNFIAETGRFTNFNLARLDQLVLLCTEASLPGSTLFTHEVTNDYPGVTEKMVYRRQYDDYSSFTFLVDEKYEIIELFESWFNYIVNEDSRDNYMNYNASYRMKFREDYAASIAITKFERNIGAVVNSQDNTPSLTGPRMNYEFIQAFPISINSMPVSYENSTVLKCTVNFTYLRYVRERLTK